MEAMAPILHRREWWSLLGEDVARSELSFFPLADDQSDLRLCGI
jgi:hypothetical protein